ncbi:MarR family winged helix-turn-helix transcriptional regulator [Rummeliibacillus sp. NPDC094406]|uniref:MarR family winged helix-turn-helix transcriptional regulator n=1 Tax=Rummeliibacillus sp. NPDC094406 TaxID=3364511 RepID=UPI003805C933
MKKNTLESLTWMRITRFVTESNYLSNEFLKSFDLTVAQFDVLIQIQTYQPITQSELAEKVTVTQGGISRMLARLEKDGLIERKQEWKIKKISLTEQGEDILKVATPEQVAFQSSFFNEALTEEELKLLYELTTKLQKHTHEKNLQPE